MLTLTNRIDMRPGAVPLVIHLGQYDSDFSLVFELYSSAGNFTVESGTTAMIRGTKTDGNAYDADATIDVSAKTVTVAGSEQMTAAKGRNIYELVLKKGTKVLSTANFILDVERAAMDADTIASESVLKELNAIIAGAETATEAAADAASAADRAEDAADSVSSASAQIATNTADIADLKADLNDSLCYWNPLGVKGNPGYYDPGANEFKSTSSTSWKYALFDVTDMLEVKVSCYGGAIAKGWSFRDANNALIETSSETSDTQYIDELLVVPSNAVQLILNAGTQGIGVVKCSAKFLYDMEDYDLANVNALIEQIYSYKSLPITQQDGYFDPKAQTWSTSSAWKYAVVSLPETNKIKVSCKGGDIARGWAFLDKNDGVITYSPETLDTVYTNELVDVPKGATKVVLNGGNSGATIACAYYAPSDISTEATKVGKSYIQFDGTNLYIKRKYDATHDMCIYIHPKGPNALPEIDRVFLVDNAENVVSDSIAESSALLINISDWIAPYMARAVSNADGDLPDGWYAHFCGGNHSYNNTSSGVATAKNTTFKVFVNGIDSNNINGFYDSCDILVVNRIQATNTKKADGTGREVIEQTLAMHYTSDGTFTFEERTKALEDVLVLRHYTPQVYFNGSYSVQFVGGANRSVLSAPTTANSGNKTCHEYRVFTNELTVVASVDRDTDIGDFSLNTAQDHSAFTEPYNKTYMRVIDTTVNDVESNLPSGQILVLDGKYKFINTAS